jgi:hypothetical protein
MGSRLRRLRPGAGAFALYAGVAFLIFGLPLLTDRASSYAGRGADPQVFIWAFAWWPHAILHGENPFVTHAVWSPTGVNLAWATAVPGLALLFAPLTLAAGPIASYNVAAVLMPALAAWTAFLLCRHLTRRVWPSLVGGYLFGFSSYMLGQEEGHMQVSSVFLVPLVALVVLRYVQGELNARGLVIRLGPLLALQLLFSTELIFTLTLALVCSLVLGFVVAPDRRRRLIDLVAPLAGSYLLAAVLTTPFIYYLVTGFQKTAVHPPQEFVTDLLNFVVPTRLVLPAHGWTASIVRHFPGNESEQGAYLGVPTLLIVALFAWTRRRTAGGRLLVLSFLLATLASLGPTLTIDGKRSLPLPWEHIGYLPLFDNVLVERLSLYVALAAALMVSLWMASRPVGVLSVLLAVLAIVAIAPNPTAGWTTPYAIPRIFTDRSYRTCLSGQNILPLPVNYNGISDLWQVGSGFRFTMAGGYVVAAPPASFLAPKAVRRIALGLAVPADRFEALRTYIHDNHVTSVVVDASQTRYWAGALDRLAKPHDVGGVLLYRFAAQTGACPAR